MMNGSQVRAHGGRRRGILGVAAAAMMVATLLVWSQPASAHWADVGDLSVECQGDQLVLNWETVSWNLTERRGLHPEITVELSLDGGPFTLLASGAYTDANGRRFGGTVPIPFTVTTIRVLATASEAEWEGTTFTGGSRWKNITNTIRSCSEVEPAETPTPEPTETPTPEPAETPTPEPAETPTPEPAETPTPEVEPTVEERTPEVEETPTPEPAETATPEPPRTDPTATPGSDVNPVVVIPTPTTPTTIASDPVPVSPTTPSTGGGDTDEPEVLGASVTRSELANTGAETPLLFVVGMALLVGGTLLAANAARLRHRGT